MSLFLSIFISTPQTSVTHASSFLPLRCPSQPSSSAAAAQDGQVPRDGHKRFRPGAPRAPRLRPHPPSAQPGGRVRRGEEPAQGKALGDGPRFPRILRHAAVLRPRRHNAGEVRHNHALAGCCWRRPGVHLEASRRGVLGRVRDNDTHPRPVRQVRGRCCRTLVLHGGGLLRRLLHCEQARAGAPPRVPCQRGERRKAAADPQTRCHHHNQQQRHSCSCSSGDRCNLRL